MTTHWTPPPPESDVEKRVRDRGYVCVLCNGVLGLTFAVLAGEGLIHDGPCPQR